jgi:hypothetical protein
LIAAGAFALALVAGHATLERKAPALERALTQRFVYAIRHTIQPTALDALLTPGPEPMIAPRSPSGSRRSSNPRAIDLARLPAGARPDPRARRHRPRARALARRRIAPSDSPVLASRTAHDRSLLVRLRVPGSRVARTSCVAAERHSM